MLRELRVSKVPGVAQRVVPLLASFSVEVMESLKEVMNAWQLRVGVVPARDV